MLRQRLLVAIVAIPLLAALIHLGGWPWAGTVALVLLLAAWEYAQLVRRIGFSPSPIWMGAMILAFLADAIHPPQSARPAELALTLMPPLTLVWFWWLRRSSHPLADWAFTAAGGLYLGWLGRSFIWIRNLPDPEGRGWTAFALLVTWAADTGAYAIGSRWGRRKLAPRLSPGKTWEGFLGGCAAGLLAGALLGVLLGAGAGAGALLGLLIGSLGTLGDLSISVLKRQAGVKDSGNLFPGHGGALDRLDSLLWSGAIVYLYLRWIRG
ncbi:MAG: phosphatidate cytidylyltransferase [Thermoflexus sp.]